MWTRIKIIDVVMAHTVGVKRLATELRDMKSAMQTPYTHFHKHVLSDFVKLKMNEASLCKSRQVYWPVFV